MKNDVINFYRKLLSAIDKEYITST